MRRRDAEAVLLGEVGGDDPVDDDDTSLPMWGDLGDAIALLRDEELRPALVASAIDALEAGVPAEEVRGITQYLNTDGRRWLTAPGTAERELITGDLREAHRRRDNAVRSSNDAADDDLRLAFLATAQNWQQEITRLNVHLASLDAAEERETLPVNSFEADIDVILCALARLAQAEIRGTADEVIALHRLLVDTSVVSVDAEQVVLRYHMLVPNADGVRRLGPIDFSVPNRIPPLQPGNGGCPWILAERVTGETEAQLRDRPVTAVRRFVRHALENAGYDPVAARVLVLCPIPEVAVAVARDLGFTELPPGDSAFERWIIGRYKNGPLSWRPMYYVEDPLYGQAAIDHLMDLGPSSGKELAELIGCDDHSIRALTATRSARGDRPLEPALVWVGSASARRAREPGAAKLRCRTCPHCGAALTFYCKTPETGRLLCDSCRRAPMPGSPVFPESYWSLRLPRYAVGRRQRNGADPDRVPAAIYHEAFWTEWNEATGSALTTTNRAASTTGIGATGISVEVRCYRSKVRVALVVTNTPKRDDHVKRYLRNGSIRSAYGSGLVLDIQPDRKAAILGEELVVDLAKPEDRARAIAWLRPRRDALVEAARAVSRDAKKSSVPPTSPR